MAIFRKIPTGSAAASVYAITVILIYGWTAYWFMWKLPSWIYYLSITEILTIAAYSALANLFESLLIFSAPLVLAIIFPKQWFSDRFVSAGSLLGLLTGGYLIYFSSVSGAAGSFSYAPLIQAVVFFIIAVGIAMFASRARVLSNLIEAFTDRAKIFLYLSLPLSVLSVFVVVARNLSK
ncbi:MAG: hypothetical protein MUO77_19360 [Anaerolineales bacterium]|nr:hypothetical protein [Anaerolineales bacterium]